MKHRFKEEEMMMTRKEKKRVPELRFAGFEGEWEKNKLRNISNRVTSKNKIDNQNVLTISAQKGLVSQLEYFKKSVSAKNLTGYYLLKRDDFAYNKSYSIGYPTGAIKRLNNYALGLVSTLYICFRFNESISLDFMEQYFESGMQNREISKVAQEGARNHGLLNIGVNDFFDINVVLPSLKEQIKNGTFLTTIDTRIQQLEKKKTLLEQYKKGVMQKIFSQEIRFKTEDGKEFPKWEKKRLGEIAIKKSSNIAANKIEDNFGEYIIYGAPGILKRVDFYEEENDYISIVKDGAGVGRVLYCEGMSSVLATLDMIKPKKGLDTYFLYCLLENINFAKYVTGSTIPHIYFKDYKKELIGVPTLSEQTKIAQFLSALDRKIAVVDEQIEGTKEWKKGLLQRMFV